MTRAQFLNELYRRLGSMSREQAEQHLTYYAEMLMDRMEEGMSEEEAVASMEDVDTIARRILQEEGQPPAAPGPAPRAAQAQTPSPPPRESAPPARDWRKIAKIGLWAAAVVVVVCVAAGKLQGNRADEAVPDVPDVSDVDSGIHIGPGGLEISDGGDSVRIGPGGLEVDSDGDSVRIGPGGFEVNGSDWEDDAGEDWSGWSWSGWENDGSYDYPGESYSLSAEGIKDVEVDWVAGFVEIQPGDDGMIHFSESASRELTDAMKMVYEVKGDTLRIRFQKNDRNINIDYGKRLTLAVPEGLVEEMDVSSVSADVLVGPLQVRDLEIDTTSGGAALSSVESDKVKISTTSGDVNGYVAAREVKADTTSGNISLYGESGDTYELDTTSGSIDLIVESASELELDTVSGDVTLLLPGTMGFSLVYETVSGRINSGDFPMTIQNGRYVSGDGGCRIEVDTTSGDLTLGVN